MKRIILIFLLFLNTSMLFACPACEKQQPKLLRGITHGGGPQSQWDYVIVWIMVGIVILTLFFSIKWLVKPGEKSNNHIKRFILNSEYNEG